VLFAKDTRELDTRSEVLRILQEMSGRAGGSTDAPSAEA